jgi:hypothetical protein
MQVDDQSMVRLCADDQAVMHNGTTNRINNYLIGPLPLSDATVISPMTEMYHHPGIPLNARSTFNWTQLQIHVTRIIGPLEPIFIDLFNGSFTNGTLLPAGVGPMSYDGEWRRTWIQLRRNVPGAWLVPVDFYVYVGHSRFGQWLMTGRHVGYRPLAIPCNPLLSQRSDVSLFRKSDRRVGKG